MVGDDQKKLRAIKIDLKALSFVSFALFLSSSLAVNITGPQLASIILHLLVQCGIRSE